MSANIQPTDDDYLLKKSEEILPQHLAQQKAVIDISSQALLGTNLDQLIQHALELLLGILNVQFTEFLEYHSTGSYFFPKAGLGWDIQYKNQPVREVSAGTFSAFVIKLGQPIAITSNFTNDDRFVAPNFIKEHKVESGIAAVVQGKDQPYGVLAIYSQKARKYTDLEINFVQKIANIIALLVDRQRLESSEVTVRNELSAVLDGISEGITIQAPDFHLIYANELAAHLMGFKNREELLNPPLEDVLTEFEILKEDGTPFPREEYPGRQVLAGAEEAHTIMLLRDQKTNTSRWLMVNASPVYDAGSNNRMAVNIFQDITELKQREQEQHILAKTGELMAQAYEYEMAIEEISKLIVQNIADWCVVYLVDEEGNLKRIVTTHSDPQKAAMAREVQEKYPPNPKNMYGIFQVMESGKPQLFLEVQEQDLRLVAQNEEHYLLLKTLGMHSVLIVPIIARGHTFGAISLVYTETKRKYGEYEKRLASNLAHRAALAIDNARLYQKARDLNDELENKVFKRTAQLERVNKKLQSEINERILLGKELQRSKVLFSDLFELSPDAIFLVDRDGNIVRINAQAAAIFAYEPSELLGQKIELLLPEQRAINHQLVRLAFQENPERRRMVTGRELLAIQKTGHTFPVDILLSPVKVENEWLVICVVRDITDQKRAEAELAEVQHRLLDSLEAERLMLAQELHDGSIQELFSVNFQIAEVANDLKEKDELELAAKLQEASRMNQKVVQGLRNISRDLRPPALAPFGLEQAIISHMERFQEVHSDIHIHLDLFPDEQKLDERVRLVLFRIYQNAVSNVARHAQAKNLWVTFKLDKSKAILEIKDDGIGFELPGRWVELARRGHLGLVGTRERVEAIGGELKIESVLGEGTRIHVKAPQSLSLD